MLIQEKLPLPIAPRGGSIGTEVGLEATELPLQANLLVAFANLQSYQPTPASDDRQGGIGERLPGDLVSVTGTNANACAGPGIAIAVTEIAAVGG
jgi:hypothetical protein